MLLVAACAHSAQTNFSRVTGYQLRAWTPAVASTQKAEKAAVEREAPLADGDESHICACWKSMAGVNASQRTAYAQPPLHAGPAYSQPPIRAPPQVLV